MILAAYDEVHWSARVSITRLRELMASDPALSRRIARLRKKLASG